MKKRAKKKSQFLETWRRFRKSKTAIIGLIIFTIMFMLVIFADLIVPYEVAVTQSPSELREPPSSEHWFGTDNYGRDIFARIIHGSRYSLLVGMAAGPPGLGPGGVDDCPGPPLRQRLSPPGKAGAQQSLCPADR